MRLYGKPKATNMLNRILILILFGLVATSAATICVQIHHPFPATADEILIKLSALLLFIGILAGEYLLWCKMRLHLPPSAERKRADILPLANPSPVNAEKQTSVARRYKLLFPVYTLALLLLLILSLLYKADRLYYQAVKYGHFCTANALRLLAGAEADKTDIMQYCCGPNRHAGETTEQRTAQVRYLLKNGADPNLRQADSTPLLHSLASQSYHLLPVLLEYGADLRAPGAPWDISPAFTAVTRTDPELLRYLLQHGAEPDKPQALFGNMTPLHRAVEFAPDMDADIARRLECVRLLLEAGANVNALNKYVNAAPRTPLDMAEAKCGFTDAIPLLRKHGARHAHELPHTPRNHNRNSPNVR